MTIWTDIMGMSRETPNLAHAAECLNLAMVRLQWASHNLAAYAEYDEVEDLVAAEQALVEMLADVNKARAWVEKEINIDSAKISTAQLEEDLRNRQLNGDDPASDP